MRYLLDTHVLIWYLFGDTSISKKAKKIIDSEDCYYSLCSLWEIAIKQSLDKLTVRETIPFIDAQAQRNYFTKLDVTSNHIETIKSLPFIHHDPFDRLLIAQAKSENMLLITKDGIIPQYDVKVIW